MGLRFRKSIKLGNLLKLNISKSGVSATVGKSGTSLNIGKNGVYANVSPSVAGIKGTGVSYRKKLVGNPLKFNKTVKEEKEEAISQDFDVIVNVHKTADNVLDKDAFSKINGIDNLDLLIKGDEDCIEKEIGIFLDNLDLDYPVSCNFELEDHTLYTDLDLPEIELFKSKGINLNKEEYSKTVINLGLYLSANFFNISSYIDEIVLSGFITKRNSIGDLEDTYIYSIKYERNVFENTDLKNLDDTYNFILKFQNRINLSDSFTFKSIKPFESDVDKAMDDVVSALVNLGYKKEDVLKIIPDLKDKHFDSLEDYIKEGLKVLRKNG